MNLAESLSAYIYAHPACCLTSERQILCILQPQLSHLPYHKEETQNRQQASWERCEKRKERRNKPHGSAIRRERQSGTSRLWSRTKRPQGAQNDYPISLHHSLLYHDKSLQEARRNLRTQVMYGRTQPLDGHPKAAYVHPKPANGDFRWLKRRLEQYQKRGYSFLTLPFQPTVLSYEQ